MIFRNWVLQNFPFLEDDFDALTDYELFCKMMAYVMKQVKDNEEFRKQLAELQAEIDGLNIDDVVTEKLNEMVEDGSLGELLETYAIPYTKDSYILAVFHDYISSDYYNPYTGGSGDGRTPRFLLSKDGVNFTEFNKEIYPLMINAPTTPNGWCGAPSIVFWNNKFFMVSSGGIKTATNDGAIGVSDDLIHWTWYDYTLGVRYGDAQVIIPAPEFCVLNGDLYLVESIFTGEYDDNYQGIQVTVSEPYIAKVESFNPESGFTFTEARKLIFYDGENPNLSTDKSHIDTTIIYKDGYYYALSKNEITVAIESFRSSDLINWEILNRNCFWRYTEAPTVCYYGGLFHVYADASQLEAGSQNEMYHAVTDNFITFRDYGEVLAPRKYTTRHGSVFTITADNTLANKIIRAISDVAIGGSGLERKPVYLGLSTQEIQFPIQEGNTRETPYMSVCPNTIYYINANHDYIIDNLDNNANLGEVLFTFLPNVTKASLTIKNSGVDGNYVEINDMYAYDNSMDSSYIKLTKDGNGVLRISNRNALEEDLLSKFSSWGTFTDTSWVTASKIDDNVTITARLLAMDANTTKTLSSSNIPEYLRPLKNKIFTGFIRSAGNYVGSTWIPCMIAVNHSGSIQVFTNDNIPSGSVLEFTVNYQVNI